MPAGIISERAGDDPVGSTAEQIADAVVEVDGVTDLFSGVFGEIATYMPGGRVGGVTLDDGRGAVHVIVDISFDLRDVATEVARVASEIAGVPIDVTVEDVSIPAAKTTPEARTIEVGNDG